MPSILIKNAVIVTMNENRDIIRGNLRIEDREIAAIGCEDSPADRVIDGKGQVMIPGLIQTHVHLCQTLFRGQADDLALMDWLAKRIWPLEGAHDPESLYYSAQLGIGELLRGGTTTILDMGTVHHTDSIFQAMADSGIRAIGGKCMMDWGDDVPETLLESTHHSLRESSDLLEKWHGQEEGRLGYAFAPRFAVSCSEELLLQVRDLAAQHQVLVHTHASENQDEIRLVEAERKMRNVQYFEHLGLARENLVLAHCIWLDRSEIDILENNKVKVAHCPSCNLKLGSGIAPLPEYLSRGIQVSLGADGAPCNNNLDIFTEMRLAALIQKPLYGPTVMPAPKVFEMATLGGARVLGKEKEIGSLEVGKKADLVLLDLNQLHASPNAEVDIYSQLVYEARSHDITLTMVDGRVVYEAGRLTRMDEDDILRKVNQLIRKIRVRAGI